MKTLITALVVLFTISICTARCNKNKSITPTQNSNSSATKMKITIGTAAFTATLYDNASANEFKARLPLTIDMKELNGNEKYYDFSNPIPTNALVGGDIKVGDLTLYGDNVLVLFYKNFSTTYRYTRLGYVDKPEGLAAALGDGNVVVRFEINKSI